MPEPKEKPDDWSRLREQRMSEPGAHEAYEATRLAFELDAQRRLREEHG